MQAILRTISGKLAYLFALMMVVCTVDFKCSLYASLFYRHSHSHYHHTEVQTAYQFYL